MGRPKPTAPTPRAPTDTDARQEPARGAARLPATGPRLRMRAACRVPGRAESSGRRGRRGSGRSGLCARAASGPGGSVVAAPPPPDALPVCCWRKERKESARTVAASATAPEPRSPGRSPSAPSAAGSRVLGEGRQRPRGGPGGPPAPGLGCGVWGRGPRTRGKGPEGWRRGLVWGRAGSGRGPALGSRVGAGSGRPLAPLSAPPPPGRRCSRRPPPPGALGAPRRRLGPGGCWDRAAGSGWRRRAAAGEGARELPRGRLRV